MYRVFERGLFYNISREQEKVVDVEVTIDSIQTVMFEMYVSHLEGLVDGLQVPELELYGVPEFVNKSNLEEFYNKVRNLK